MWMTVRFIFRLTRFHLLLPRESKHAYKILTELLFIGSGNLPASQLPSFTAIDGSVIQPSRCARNLGAIFDNKLNMERQVSAICKSAFLNIRNITADLMWSQA